MTLITNADSWSEAADKALHATGQANASSFNVAQGLPNYRRRRPSVTVFAIRANQLSGNHGDNRSNIYRGLLYHEAAARAHQVISHNHFRVMGATTDEGNYGRHAEASSLHSQAAKAHLEAAQAAAGKLGMDYRIHSGLKQAIHNAQPNDAAPRLVYADFLEEHGLPREARRLRADPTGHISRAYNASRRVMQLHNYPPNGDALDTARRARHTALVGDYASAANWHRQAVREHQAVLDTLNERYRNNPNRQTIRQIRANENAVHRHIDAMRYFRGRS